MRLVILATVATTLACGSIAHAAATVWFEYAGSNAQILVLDQQGPGHVLHVGTVGFFPIDVEVEMWANVTDIGLYSANTTLSTDTSSRITTMNMIPPLSGIETPAGGLNTPGPGDIATNFGGATFTGPGYLGDNILLGTFTLRALPPDVGVVSNVFARVGNGVWAQSDSQGAPVRFGAGAFEDGGVVGNAESLAIMVEFFPEPATIGLLATCALLVLRRRR